MRAGIRPGARVLVERPCNSPCSLHCLDAVPVLEVVGTVDGLEAGADHPVVVVFDLWHLDTRWMDRFTGDELVVV